MTTIDEILEGERSEPVKVEVRVADLLPNPWWESDRPVRKEKIGALRESISQTGFWENIEGRINPDGQVELAYGWHRAKALQAEFGDDYLVPVLIRDLSDADMLRRSFFENRPEWGIDAIEEQMQARAAVRGYAEGVIDFPPPDPKAPANKLTYAPRFVPGDAEGLNPQHAYSAETLAQVLNWSKEKAKNTLAAIVLLDGEWITFEPYESLSTSQAEVITEAVRRVIRKPAERVQGLEEAAAEAAKEAEEAEDEESRLEAEEQREGFQWSADQMRRRAIEKAAHLANTLCEGFRQERLTVSQARAQARTFFVSPNVKPPPRPRPTDGIRLGPIGHPREVRYLLHTLEACALAIEEGNDLTGRLSTSSLAVLRESLTNLHETAGKAARKYRRVIGNRRRGGILEFIRRSA